MNFRLELWRLVVVAVSAVGLFTPAHAQNALSLEEAVRIALDAQDPTVSRHTEYASALDERAVADGQLPDPQLGVGLVNVPTDTFDLDQDPMTQVQIGVRQRFPRGSSLRYEQQKLEAQASGARQEAALQELRIALDVRRAWLELFYLQGALETVKRSRAATTELLQSIESSFAAGLQSNSDLLRTELERDLLSDRAIDIERRTDLLRADFARLVGTRTAARTLPARLPDLGPVPTRQAMVDALPDHPLIAVEDHRIEAQDSEVHIAKELYKPGWSLEARYGFRSSERSDLASVMVLMDMPLFAGKRQDKRLAAATREKQAAAYDRSARLLDLTQRLDRAYANWTRLGQRIDLFEKVIVNRAAETADAAVGGYQSQFSDFPELIRAQLAELDTELDLLRLRVDRAQAAAELLFLAGAAF